MYSLDFYGQMIADKPRMDAYVAALRHAVKPGAVVMDLGCGVGVFALLACKFGARRVYAVEPANIVGLAREAADANGYADKIEFFESLSTEITLPEPADVIISDLRGVLPWYQQHLPSIIDARSRHLALGGVLIPRCDLLWAGVVDAPEQYEAIVGSWQHDELDLSAGRRLITNTWKKATIERGQFLVGPELWATLNYNEVDSPDIRAELEWRVVRDGTAHGVATWFDSELAPGVVLSNHPAKPRMIYGQGLFPFPEPVAMAQGDRITLRLEARLVHDGYVWRWDTDFYGDGEQPKASFKQSTFHGVPLSKTQLSLSRKEAHNA